MRSADVNACAKHLRNTLLAAPDNPFTNANLILDALIGYGLKGAPRGDMAELIRRANVSNVPIIALDTPSGLDTSTGNVFDPCIRARATLTLALPKVGLLQTNTRAWVGKLYVADISVPRGVYEGIKLQVPNLFADSSIVLLEMD